MTKVGWVFGVVQTVIHVCKGRCNLEVKTNIVLTLRQSGLSNHGGASFLKGLVVGKQRGGGEVRGAMEKRPAIHQFISGNLEPVKNYPSHLPRWQDTYHTTARHRHMTHDLPRVRGRSLEKEAQKS